MKNNIIGFIIPYIHYICKYNNGCGKEERRFSDKSH